MAEVKKARIFLRRGTDADRLQTELCQGELGYSTDGVRVFTGDGTTLGGNSLGSTMIFKPKGFDITTLTAVSSDGRAEIGDFAFTPASAYNVTTINSSAPSTVISVNNSFGTVYTLSARDSGTGDLTWVAVNSAIPLNHIDIPDNGINGNKIHAGDISGSVTFSGSISASTLTATNVSATNVRVTGLAGVGNRPVVVGNSGDLAVATGGTGIPRAMVSFSQNPATLNYDFGVTSVQLISIGTLSGDTDSEVPIGQSDSGSVIYEEWTGGGHYNLSNNSGVYKITLDTEIGTTSAAAVEIQAHNWRPFESDVTKKNYSMVPVIDYYWGGSSNTLYVVFSVPFTNDNDRRATGVLQRLYPSSGLTDTRTRFTVKIY